MLGFFPFFPRQSNELLTENGRSDAGALAEKEAALNALFNTGAAAIAEVDLASARYVRVNRRFCEMMRREQTALLTMGPAEIIHPEDMESARSQWIEAMRGSGQWDAEVRHIGPNGEVIWARVGVSVLQRDDAGAPIRCLAVLQDITENVHALQRLRVSEDTLRQGQERTRQSEAALRALGDSLPDSVIYRFTRDHEGKARFLYISAGVERLNGLKAEDVMADADTLMSQIPPECLPERQERLDVSRRELSDFLLEAPMTRADGEIRWMRWRSRPDRQPDGSIIWNGVYTDITTERREETARQEGVRLKLFLLDLADALKRLGDPLSIMAAASEKLGKALGVHQVIYAEIDAKEEFAVIKREWSDGTMPSSIGVHRLADFGPALIARLQAGKINAVEDVAADTRAASETAATTYSALCISAFLSVPLVKGGRLVAVLALHHRQPRRWSAVDVSMVEETAERTWAAIERARAEEALRHNEERFRFALTAANAVVWEWDVKTNASVWSDELWRLYGLEPQSCEPSDDAWKRTIHPDDRKSVARAIAKAAAEGSELAVEWRVTGTGAAERWLLARGGPMRCADRTSLRFMGVVLDITERKKSEARIGYLAHHDMLTELPNRLAFNERLATAISRADQTGAALAVLCMDLDRFKEVNDVHGHAIGDELLRLVSSRLLAAAEGARIARIGGDEFTAIITSKSPGANKSLPARAATLARRLRDAVTAPFDLDGRQIRIDLSVGAALYPDQGDLETVLADAYAALHRAKAEGGGKVCLFDSQLDSRLRERHVLFQELEKAIERDELSLAYQPQANADGDIFGFEALLRWRHPSRGLISPNVFIPLAEERGLIGALGEWVLRRACREASSWPRPLTIAINLSPVQFLKDGLPGMIHAILLDTGLPAHRLELEITEGVLVDDFSRVSSILRQLKCLGVRVAIDDFGTGYSSLSYLQSFPFDKIKIDRSFVSGLNQNLNSEAIVRAIIGLGRGLGVPLIAEGVETAQQLAFLRAAGCDEAQGYLIGAPQPISAYAAMVGRDDGEAAPLPLTQSA